MGLRTVGQNNTKNKFSGANYIRERVHVSQQLNWIFQVPPEIVGKLYGPEFPFGEFTKTTIIVEYGHIIRFCTNAIDMQPMSLSITLKSVSATFVLIRKIQIFIIFVNKMRGKFLSFSNHQASTPNVFKKLFSKKLHNYDDDDDCM